MVEKPPLPTVSTAAALRPTLARTSLWTMDPHGLETFYSVLFGFTRVAHAGIGGDTPGDAIVRAWHLAAGARVEVTMLRAPRGDTELAIVAAPGQYLKNAASVRDGAPEAGSTYLVLYVPSLDDVLAACERLGVAFNRAPKRLGAPNGKVYYETAIYDPDGRVLLVVEDVVPDEKPAPK